MKVEEILKGITPEVKKREIEKIQKVELPAELQKWVKEYEKVGERDGFIWKFTYSGWQMFTLSSVQKKYQELVIINKCCNTILNVLLDDLADKGENEDILDGALKIVYPSNNARNVFLNVSKSNLEYLNLIKKVYNFIKKDLKKYPRYKEFRNVFEYDYQQFLNTMKYSYLINKIPVVINLNEHETYSHHNMQGMIGMTIDLMCSSEFNIKELGIFREIAWKMQQMGRIGNLITTWEREIYDNDFTSGIFAYALKKNIINVNDLKMENKRNKIIKKIKTSKIEDYFLKQWENYYKEVDFLGKDFKSIDVQKMLNESKNFLVMHIITKEL